MIAQENTQAPLSPYRALDLTDEKGMLCGRILGDLGVDVIKIEVPGGDRSRNLPPFYGDIPHPEKSLVWFAYNANKRGITLNIRTKEGQRIFLLLLKRTHFVLESFPPGYLDEIGLGYSTMKEANPEIILTSITPFGQDGPYKEFKATDIISMAMGGLMYLCGDSDRSPLRPSFPQAFLHAGAEAAVGTLIAHYYRETTGQGQQVDVSIQESVLPTLMNARHFWDLNQVVLQRAGSFRMGLSSEARQKLIWRCKDGYITFALIGGAFGAPTNKALMQWVEAEGFATDFLRQVDWDAFDMATTSQEYLDSLAEPMDIFFRQHTKMELYQGALKRGIMLYPVNTMEDIAQDHQLKARGFWEAVAHPELNTIISYPGAFIKFSQTPCCISRRAPLMGEHNQEIYHGELGFSEAKMVILQKQGVI